MKVKEIVEKINSLLDEKNNDELQKFIQENPRFAQGYIEYEILTMQMIQLRIQRVTLDMAYLIGKNKDEKK